MRARNFFLLAALLLSTLFLSSAAAEKGQTLGTEELKRIFTELYTSRMIWSSEDLVVERFAAVPARVSLPSGELGYRADSQLHPEYLGKKSAKVILTIDGRDSGEVKLSGEILLFGEVVCAARQLGKGHTLTQDDVVLVRRDLTYLGADLIDQPDKIMGKKLKASLRAGVALKAQDLEDPPLVRRGDIVTILAKSESIRITVPGMIRSAGGKGEVVRVKNLASRREIFATVADGQTVEVEF